MNRGRRGVTVFQTADDHRLFMDILHEVIKLFSLRISACCLMSNHYHLQVQTPDGNLSRCMRRVRDGNFINGFKRMKRHELEHIIRAAGAISATEELVIIGSQARLAVSKLVAGRGKDVDFVARMIEHRMVSFYEIEALSDQIPEYMRVGLQSSLKLVRRRRSGVYVHSLPLSE